MHGEGPVRAFWERFCTWLVREATDIWDDYLRGVVGGIVVACVVLLGFWVVQRLTLKLFPDGGGPYIQYIIDIRGIAALAALAGYALRSIWQTFRKPSKE